MAALGAQSIASSYEQLLHVDRDGGGNSTTHVAIKDGDNGTTFGFTIATDALMMSSTNRLEFGDTGTYIHQSADGVLDLVSDTEIEINATTIDINGALDLSGNAQLSGTVTVGADGSGTDVIFYSGTAGDSFAWDASEEKLTITGTNGQTALDVADGNLVVADNIDLEGDIDVNGTANLDNTDIDGTFAVDGTTISLDATTSLNIDNSNTSNGITIGTATSGVPISIGHSTSETTVNDNLVVTGDIDLAGSIDVDGTANLDVVDIDGAFTQDGGAVFNEDSADVDFRVESNGNANMLVVDGGEDMVFVGTSNKISFDAYQAEVMMQMEAVGTAPYAGLGMVQNSNDTDSSVLIFGKSRGTSAASTTVVQDNDLLGRIEFQGMDGSDLETGASITAEVDGTPGDNDMPGRLVFKTTADGADSATARMTIKNDGKIGVGTANPIRALGVSHGAAKTSTSTAYAMSIQSNESSGQAALQFYAVGGASAAVRRFQIQTGEVGVANGGIIEFQPDGGDVRFPNGILFGSDTAAANTLDDYEEGTITPTLLGSSSNPTQTYDSRGGFYQKIGNRVFYTIRIEMNGSGISAGSGDLIIGGLPFTIANDVNNYGAVTIGIPSGFGTGQHGAPTNGYHSINETLLRLQVYDNDGGNIAGASNADAADVTNGTTITVSGNYKV